MKELYIDEGITFYDVLRTKDDNKLASLIRNKTGALTLERFNYDNEFPIYAKNLLRQVKIGKERLHYLDIGIVILKNMEHISGLSHFSHIILMIAENFTKDEIKRLKKMAIESLDEKE